MSTAVATHPSIHHRSRRTLLSAVVAVAVAAGVAAGVVTLTSTSTSTSHSTHAATAPAVGRFQPGLPPEYFVPRLGTP